MSREIKFRAWDTREEHWAVNLFDGVSPEGQAFYTHEDGIEWCHEYAVMQYTGLKDKNCREVYESDLVVPQGGYEDGECDHPSEVHWNDYNLQWEALCKMCASAVPLSEFDLHSVVGNVWENPDLLESKDAQS